MRHKVGAENGSGATALAGLLLLRTSWDSRSQALSGKASKIAVVVLVEPTGVGVVWRVILCRSMKLKRRDFTPGGSSRIDDVNRVKGLRNTRLMRKTAWLEDLNTRPIVGEVFCVLCFCPDLRPWQCVQSHLISCVGSSL